MNKKFRTESTAYSVGKIHFYDRDETTGQWQVRCRVPDDNHPEGQVLRGDAKVEVNCKMCLQGITRGSLGPRSMTGYSKTQ